MIFNSSLGNWVAYEGCLWKSLTMRFHQRDFCCQVCVPANGRPASRVSSHHAKRASARAAPSNRSQVVSGLGRRLETTNYTPHPLTRLSFNNNRNGTQQEHKTDAKEEEERSI